jgi:hypothetical protein
MYENQAGVRIELPDELVKKLNIGDLEE